MNEQTNQKLHISDIPMPSRVHAKIMRRVFLAGYGKYLALLSGILALNLSVLGTDLYRAFTTDTASNALKALRQSFVVTPSYLASAAHTLYSIIPAQSLIAITLTLTFSVFITVMFVKIYKNPTNAKLFKSVA
jgi:hypothetical protein